MRRAHYLPLALAATLVACEPGDPSTAGDPVAPSPLTPSMGATVLKIPRNFFFLQDFDRDISGTIGLVSAVSDLGTDPDCGGSGPEVYDGGAIDRIVETPSGRLYLRSELHQGTLTLYEGATNDVCELATHPVIARGPVNSHFSLKFRPDGSVFLQATLVGNLELSTGGTAHHVSTANAVFETDGSITIHVDKFELKPIGH